MSLFPRSRRILLACYNDKHHPHRIIAQSLSSLVSDAVVHRRGDPDYGTREYLLLPANATLEQVKIDPRLSIASLFAYKNIIFGARVQQFNPSLSFDILEACKPLLEAALIDAGDVGEQPQAMASLAGLCQFVQTCVEKDDIILKGIDDISLEACKAIASGVPRPGHSVVGAGTFRDGQAGWDVLAREFIKRNLAQEVNLYKSLGGELVGIEHLADKSDAYIKTAGGAMCRLFFV